MECKVTDLKNFVIMSTSSTITDAARKLEVSQPALSESLKRLETDTGTTLFYRSRSGIQLTSTGRLFLEKAKEAIAALNSLDLSKDDSRIFSGKSISIGCHSAVARYSIPKALTILKEKAPDYKIELRHDLSRNIQMEIQRGKIDIGIIINPVPVPDIIITKLATDTVSVWTAHEGQKLDTVVCNLDLIQTQSILRKWRNKPERIISTESLELVCSLVAANIGYGIIPERVVRSSSSKLIRNDDLPKYRDEICIVYRPEFGRAFAEQLVVASLKASLV